jgi:hypothetical protein
MPSSPRKGGTPPAGNPQGGFPRKDCDGRIVSLPELLGGVLFSIVLGVIALVAIDGIFTVLGVGEFGTVSGWLAGILTVWMFVEEFRAWKGVPARIAPLVVAGAVGVLAGAALSARLIALPAVFAGSISVAVAGLIYAVIWYFGIRYLASRLGER